MPPVPAWNAQGVIEPVDPLTPTSALRSPYKVSLVDLVATYATSNARNSILSGFLDYRARLHSIGLTSGFQWVDGSFTEHIELLEGRDPGDIDVVTFYELPAGQTQSSLMAANPDLFPADAVAHKALKSKYFVDAYALHLGTKPKMLVSRSAYWYSMWSHRRNFVWKGFLEIDLSPSGDALARAALPAATVSTNPTIATSPMSTAGSLAGKTP